MKTFGKKRTRLGFNIHLLFSVFFSVILLFPIIPPSVEGNVVRDQILIGMSTALSGPASDIGRNMKMGVEACFKETNDSGGIHGRPLKLVVLDDGYQPDSAEKNMNELVDTHKVLAVVGNVGTPTAERTVPIANKKRVLLYGAFTGAGILRKNPPDRYIINFRASYAEETAAMVNGLLQMGTRPNEIAFLTQNDGYGQSGYDGAVAALRRKGYMNTDSLVHGRYNRNTLNVEDAVVEIATADIDPMAVIMVGTYMPVARFIKFFRSSFPDTYFLNVSFVGSSSLLKVLGPHAENVIVTQVVPHYNSDLPGVAAYRNAMRNFFPENTLSFVSLEGYLASKLFVESLKRVGGPLTRESIIDALETIQQLDIGIGIFISLGKTNHQALHTVWPTKTRKTSTEIGPPYVLEPYAFGIR